MPRNDSGCGQGSEGQWNGVTVDRRSYLKFAGTVVGSAGVLSGTASAAERRGIRFNRVVDMVADAGCDPTGQEPCNAKIREAADDYTLLKFPAGTYKLTEKNAILGVTNLGFLGEGDVRFTVPERFNEKALVVDRGTGLLFENINVDLTADGATPGLHLAADDDLQVHDVEFVGPGVHPENDPQECGNNQIDGCHGNESVTKALYPIVRSPDGSGVVRNVVARNAGVMGAYTRTGVWVGISTEGTIRLENCRFEEFPGNGLYCSRTYGVVQVEGGEFRNNDIAQVRLGSQGSYVRDATIEVDGDDTRSPNPGEALNQRGVWFESGSIGASGPEVRDCDITIAETSNSSGGVVTSSSVGNFSVVDTRIGVGVDGVRSILGHSPADEPHSAVFRGVDVTGDAANAEAIRLVDYPDSLIEGCCIRQDGPDRDGVVLVDSGGTSVYDSTIAVRGRPVVREDSPGVDDFTTDGECSRSDGGSGWRSRSSGALTVASNGGRAEYRLTVGDDLEQTNAMEATVDDNDDLVGNTAFGQVDGGGRDSYTFSGGVLAFEMDGDASLYLDGREIVEDQLPDNTLTVASEGGQAEYRMAVSIALGKSPGMGATIDDNDDRSGAHASGQVGGGGRDSYGFTGEITSFDMDGDASVYLNGEAIDADQLPDDTLTITSNGGSASYRFTVGGDLEQSPVNGATVDDNDDTDGETVSGQVDGGGRDSYTFSGGVLAFEMDGDATIYLNDEEMAPDQFPDNTLTIDGDGGETSYEFTVSTALGKTTGMNASINGEDDRSGAHASGRVNGNDRDSYGFTGEITSFRYGGNATVFVNGATVDPNSLPDNTLTIAAGDGRSTYEFTVDDTLEESTVNGATIDDTDAISGTTASGQVGDGGRDSYTFSGTVREFTLDGDATIYLNDRQRSPEELPGD